MSRNVIEGMKRVSRTPEQEAAFQADLAARRANIAADLQKYQVGNAKLAAAAAKDVANSTTSAAPAVKISSNTILRQLQNQFKWP